MGTGQVIRSSPSTKPPCPPALCNSPVARCARRLSFWQMQELVHSAVLGLDASEAECDQHDGLPVLAALDTCRQLGDLLDPTGNFWQLQLAHVAIHRICPPVGDFVRHRRLVLELSLDPAFP